MKDPYLYPNTEIIVNKFDIKDIDKLNSLEAELSNDETAVLFSKNMAQLWKVHPFREGNTRTIITFCCYYAEREGFQLDTDLLKDNSDYVRNALVAASAAFNDLGDKSNPEYLIRIIKDAMERGKNV